MKIVRVTELPQFLRDFCQVVIRVKAAEAEKEAKKGDATGVLKGFLGDEQAVIAVSRKRLILCDINPQSHAEFDPADPSPEIQAILKAQKEVKDANARLQMALAAGKAAKKVTIRIGNSIRVEPLSPDKTADMKLKYAAQLKGLRERAEVTA